jgi:uncharacterized membrane protein
MMVKSKNNNTKIKKNFDEYVTGWMGSIPSILVHTVLFIIFLTLPWFTKINYDFVLLILTTIVSLEAIYLALFIQMSINRQTIAIDEVSEDIEEIQEDVEEISEDIEEVHEHVEELTEDVEEIQEDMEEAEKEEELEEMEEEQEEAKENRRKEEQMVRLEKIENALELLLKEINGLKK